MPGPGEQVLGGHAVLAVGYDDAEQRLLAKNSWGEAWGKKGYFTIPYAYVTNTNLAATSGRYVCLGERRASDIRADGGGPRRPRQPVTRT